VTNSYGAFLFPPRTCSALSSLPFFFLILFFVLFRGLPTFIYSGLFPRSEVFWFHRQHVSCYNERGQLSPTGESNSRLCFCIPTLDPLFFPTWGGWQRCSSDSHVLNFLLPHPPFRLRFLILPATPPFPLPYNPSSFRLRKPFSSIDWRGSLRALVFFGS